MKLSPSIFGAPEVVDCDFDCSATTAELKAKDIHDRIVSVVGFRAQRPHTPVGLEIVKSALIAWMMGKFRRSALIKLSFELDQRSFSFLDDLNTQVIGSLEDSQPPHLVADHQVDVDAGMIEVARDEVIIGDSGGRDSYISGKILEACGYKLHKYKMSYDMPSPLADYSTYEYDLVNGLEKSGHYEPFDIPVTYLAPFWGTRNSAPEYLSVGHSFDVLGFDSSRRKAPYESPATMKLHQRYLDSLLGKATQFIFPISTLSTHSVFEYTRRQEGLDAVEAKVSCWNSTEADCGHCEKCQRIKLACASMHLPGYQYLPGIPQVIDSHSYLFGNPHYDALVARYGADYLSDCQLFTPELPCNQRIVDYLGRTFTKAYKILDGRSPEVQPIHFSGDTNRIGQQLGISYDRLPSQRLNTTNKRLPYEELFDRETPVLAAHGEIPYFHKKFGWQYRHICEGPRLEVPDTELFRRFFAAAEL